MKKLWYVVIVVIGIWVAIPGLDAAGQHPTPQPPEPRQSPNAPTNQNVPQGLEPPSTVETTKIVQDTRNEQELRANVERLYVFVSELKNEVDKTNSNLVLNISLVKRAHEIEKLAKQIKDRAKQ